MATMDNPFYEVLQLNIWFHYQFFPLDFRFESLSVALPVLGDIASLPANLAGLHVFPSTCVCCCHPQ
jgi:hypothetical protein